MAKTAVTAVVDRLTFEEYARATRRIRWRVVLLSVIAGEIAAILICALLKASIWLALIIPAAALIISLAVWPFTSRTGYRKISAGLRNLSYTFTEQGVEVRRGKEFSKCRWESIQRLDMDPKCIMIYPNSKSVNIIPRRCLRPGDGDIILSFYQKAVPTLKK
ncbi:MAG: YcxB family protein [Clostridiales bacterium]|jgi:hypothetical protein|nr:YcxB family protein [Clostridiales bacterium]